jgi:hypothetical protein
MISGVRRAIVAMFATLATASVCLAQESTPPVVADTATVAPAPTSSGTARPAEPTTGSVTGRGGIGGQIGTSSFRFDRVFGEQWFGDYSAGSSPRLSFHGHWRYQMNSFLRWQVAMGFTWAGYGDDTPLPFPDLNYPDDTNKAEVLTLMVPVSATLQYVRRTGPWILHVGAGPGAYRVWVENRRKVLKDPVSLKLHRGVYPGFTAELGAEKFLKSLPSTSLEFALASHLAATTRDEQFPSGFNSHVMAVELRFGANYYFLPGDRKKPLDTPRTTTP